MRFTISLATVVLISTSSVWATPISYEDRHILARDATDLSVKVCTDKALTGTCINIKVPVGKCHDFTKMKGKIDSFEPTAGGETCTLYETPYCNGNQVKGTRNKGDGTPDLGSLDKKAASVMCQAGMPVKMCTDKDLSGNCKTLTIVPDQCHPLTKFANNVKSFEPINKGELCTMYKKSDCSDTGLTSDRNKGNGEASMGKMADATTAVKCTKKGAAPTPKPAVGDLELKVCTAAGLDGNCKNIKVPHGQCVPFEAGLKVASFEPITGKAEECTLYETAQCGGKSLAGTRNKGDGVGSVGGLKASSVKCQAGLQVKLCTNDDLAGTCKDVNVPYDICHKLGTLFNDKVGSFMPPKGEKCTVYKGDTCTSNQEMTSGNNKGNGVQSMGALKNSVGSLKCTK